MLCMPLQSLTSSLDAFYEQLSFSIAQQPFSAAADASKSILMNASAANYTAFNISRSVRGLDGGIGEVRRHIERLLLRLDFNQRFSQRRDSGQAEQNILSAGGIF
jgi:gamma-tubulin complex component 4